MIKAFIGCFIFLMQFSCYGRILLDDQYQIVLEDRVMSESPIRVSLGNYIDRYVTTAHLTFLLEVFDENNSVEQIDLVCFGEIGEGVNISYIEYNYEDLKQYEIKGVVIVPMISTDCEIRNIGGEDVDTLSVYVRAS